MEPQLSKPQGHQQFSGESDENKTISDGGITVDFSIIKVHTSKDNRGLLQKLLSFRYQKPNQIPIEGTVSNPEFEPNQISEPEPDENRSSFDHGEVD